MKKIIISIAVMALFVACGGNDSKEKKETETEPAKTETTDITQHPDYQNGLAIEAKLDCATCHRVEEKVQGPSYREIANKYAGSDTAIDYLAKKIIKGGGGVWGEIMMAPHPSLSEEDAKTLARYILLMKK